MRLCEQKEYSEIKLEWRSVRKSSCPELKVGPWGAKKQEEMGKG